MRRLWWVFALPFALVACTEDDEDPEYSNVGVVRPGAPANPPPPRTPGPRPDSAPDPEDAAVDAGPDAATAADVSVDATPDASPDAAAPDAQVECVNDDDCVLGVQLDSCDVCPLGTTQAAIDADPDDCLVRHQGANVGLFEYEPFECHAACGAVSPICEEPAPRAVCNDGACGI